MDISRYQAEIDIIKTNLNNLICGDWYETTNNKRDGSFRNNAIIIKEIFCNLINKIENDKEGMRELLNKMEK